MLGVIPTPSASSYYVNASHTLLDTVHGSASADPVVWWGLGWCVLGMGAISLVIVPHPSIQQSPLHRVPHPRHHAQSSQSQTLRRCRASLPPSVQQSPHTAYRHPPPPSAVQTVPDPAPALRIAPENGCDKSGFGA
ncbi:hypothetical protein M427DRAFT_153434 [Gonapodya prolifera JEL478]|uniref:Uncharacterized protein n=1 Tax=Gonapodya prolifera (strain JEL478) TaxID=1344416 RepID=A0A139AMC0_GONPJ|nr:hypothetical protein M427DRAFT_153434 [Gonapodya prolifera JEL478]|eukprot:KXS17848.1 hypothetical protein M427DRAFT_153434 [Gonapodya prolifera JEL478]